MNWEIHAACLPSRSFSSDTTNRFNNYIFGNVIAGTMELRAFIIALAFIAVVGWVISDLQNVCSCIQTYPQQLTDQKFQESISQFLIATRIIPGPRGTFIYDNGEAIIAAFTIVLALSTIFL